MHFCRAIRVSRRYHVGMKTNPCISLVSLVVIASLAMALMACSSSPKKRAAKAATVGAVGVGTSAVIKDQTKDKAKDNKPSVPENERGPRDR